MNERLFTVLRIALFVLLLLAGGATLAAYLAVPVHQQVLLSDAARATIGEACGGSRLCVGWRAIAPFVGYTFQRAEPFLAYAVVSALALLALVGWEFFQSGRWGLRLRMTPLRVLLAFFACLWLLFTSLSFWGEGDSSFARLYEPTPQVYASASQEGLEVLQENFNRLNDRGCLTRIGSTQSGSGVFEVKRICMQGAFVTRVLTQAALVLLLLFVFLTLGRRMLRLLRVPVREPLAELLFSAGLGAGGIIAILWLLAQLSLYTQAAGWAVLLLAPVLLFKDAWYWLQSLRRHAWMQEGGWGAGVTLFLAWLLLSYLAFNFLNVIRPFPIGWDDLGKYINQPRLLVSYGHAIPQLGAFFWEYITSLGFLLFGFDSVFGATAAMQFNWTAGLLAVLSVYGFGRLFFGRGGGLLSALLYYALPVVGHFSFADMKVDNAVFFLGALSALAVFLALFPRPEDDPQEDAEECPGAAQIDWRWFLLAGILGALSFSMKPTAIMVLMALGTVLFGVLVHWSAFIGAIALAWALYTKQNVFNLRDVGTRVYGDPQAFTPAVIIGALAVLGIGLLVYAAVLHRDAMRRTLMHAAVFIGGFVLTILPWILVNNIQYGYVVPHLLSTGPDRITPTFIADGKELPDYGQDVRRLPAELQVDSTKCVGTSKSEELDRYWGKYEGWKHYLTLPWRSVMNMDSAGYYVTTFPALLLVPLLLLLPFFWMRRGRWLRWLFLASAFMVLQWIFFANGIIWYGVGMFLGIVILLEALVLRAPDVSGLAASSVFIALSLLSAFAMRFWQFEQQRSIFEYPMGKVSATVLAERTIPHYDDIREIIEERQRAMPDRPYVYRVGTFIPYFIPRNLEVLPVADHQLDMFTCLFQERDPAKTLRRLQALGFHSIIFDTNTATIERDTNGSLHKKVQAFVDFVNTPGLGLQLAVNDPDAGIAFVLLP